MMSLKACLNLTATVMLACLFPSGSLIQASALEIVNRLLDAIIRVHHNAA